MKVSANGVQLTEGIDYTVDYMLGTVTIINEQVKQSGQAINISLENQLTFNTQRKRFLGLNLERRFNENFILGEPLLIIPNPRLPKSKLRTGSRQQHNGRNQSDVQQPASFPDKINR